MQKRNHAQLSLSVVSICLGIYLLIQSPSHAFSALRALLLAQNNQSSRLTLTSIFDPDQSDLTPNSSATTILATGDVSLGRMVNIQTMNAKDPRWPFLKISSVLQEADISFINLEGPLPLDCPRLKDGMRLCGNQFHIQGLKHANITIANLANNHIGDFGANGTIETVRLLKEHGIEVTGQKSPTIITSNNTRFAFLGFNDIQPKQPDISWANPEFITTQIQEAKKTADVVIVTFHWGIEYQEQPSQRQISLGHLAIESGADVVIGNHPHWIQPVEIYKNKPIFYALGNFIFDQEWSQKTKEGMLVKLIYDGAKLKHIQLIPIAIGTYGQPKIIDDEQIKKVKLNEMYEASKVLESRIQNKQ